MELQGQVDALRARGLGLAAVSYDAPEVLAAFAAKHAITFPLLSDRGSATIRRWGLINAAAGGREEGIPHPGTFVIDRRGRIVSRTFNEQYQVRDTAASVLAQAPQAPRAPLPKPGVRPQTVKGRQLSLTTSQSDASAAPGTKLSLLVDVVPGPKMHVYAPEQTGGYIRISLTLDENAAARVGDAVYPKASDYYFEPLKETFKVFDAPFRIRQPLTVALTPDVRKRAAAGETLVITGTLRYQACDDAVCYRPEDLKVRWTIDLKPLQR